MHKTTDRQKSENAAAGFISSLKTASAIAGIAAIIGSFVSVQYEHSMMIDLFIGTISAWAAICMLLAGFTDGRLINFNLQALLFVLLVLVSPLYVPVFMGILVGLCLYLVIVVLRISNPNPEILEGDRFYIFRHPLDKLFPLTYLAPEPLSPVFSPSVILTWESGYLGIPVPRVDFFDPISLHNFVLSYSSRFSSLHKVWYRGISSHREALSMLNLFDSLRKLETYSLDGAALAAAVRLAIHKYPANALDHLRIAASSFSPEKRRNIMRAFNLRAA